MQQERILIIIHDEYLLRFALFEAKDSSIRAIAVKDLRIYCHSYNFSISEYILQALTHWGTELSIKLVEEMVPIIPKRDNVGVDDIFIFSYKEDEGLNVITKKVFIRGKEITQEGALNLTKFVDFSNLLYISFGNSRTLITRYKKDIKGVMKVVSESKEFDLKSILAEDNFLAKLKNFKSIRDFDRSLNLFRNFEKIPLFKVSLLGDSLIEYLLNMARLKAFEGCKKLNLAGFGEDGLEKTILIISGDRTRLISNIPLQILSVLSAFNLNGAFRVYVDRFGFFDFLQKQEEQILSDQFYSSFCLDFWGDVITISPKKVGEQDEVVAAVEVKDGDTKNQLIPMFGRIFKFNFLEGGSVKLAMRKGYFVGKKLSQLEVKDAREHLVIDARARPIEKNFNLLKEEDLLKMWLRGIDAGS